MTRQHYRQHDSASTIVPHPSRLGSAIIGMTQPLHRAEANYLSNIITDVT
jgi:hypothetical protein